MATEAPLIIRVITSKHPYDLANQIYHEYESRHKDVMYYLFQTEGYASLKKNLKTIELLLGMSIFHKRVIANLDAATKFHKTVTTTSKTDVVEIGRYQFDSSEKNKMLHIILSFRDLKEKYGIADFVFEYNETRDFLKNIKKMISRRKRPQDGDY